MPDSCYESCKTAVDQVINAMKLDVDICQGSLTQARSCLDEIGDSTCRGSPFMGNHYADCNATEKRVLEEQEESAELVPALLLNNSQVATVKTKNLMSLRCHSKMGQTTWMGDGWCMAWKVGGDFTLSIKWGNIYGQIGVCMECEACADFIKIVFKVAWSPLVAKVCIGGGIYVTIPYNVKPCPDVPFVIKGKVYWKWALGVDFDVVSVNFATLEMGIAAGNAWMDIATHCWMVHDDGRRRRRRWWTRRRRAWRACHYARTCDFYISGYLELPAAVVKAKLEWIYWVKVKRVDINAKFFVYEFWKVFWAEWTEYYNICLARYWF